MNNYNDIIDLNYPFELKHPRMSIESRTAQFAPFSALTGYSEAIKETARLTYKKIEIDEGLKIILNNKLQIILENIDKKEIVIFTYFTYDKKKEGGKYIEKSGIVKKIDLIEQYIVLMDKTKISINEIINIKSDLFKNYENE